MKTVEKMGMHTLIKYVAIKALRMNGYTQTAIAQIGKCYQSFISKIEQWGDIATGSDVHQDTIIAHALERGVCAFIDKEGVTGIDFSTRNKSMYKIIKSLIMLCNLKTHKRQEDIIDKEVVHIAERAVGKFVQELRDSTAQELDRVYNRLSKEHDKIWKERIVKGQ